VPDAHLESKEKITPVMPNDRAFIIVYQQKKPFGVIYGLSG